MGTRLVGADLSDRDRAIVELVAHFRQVTHGQIQDSLFADVASRTPLDRALKRLLEQKHLTRLQRLVGGGGEGGSSQYVYQLGRAGWKLLDKPGAYWAPRAVNLHALAVADCYAALKRAEYASEIEVIQFTTEPDCHQVVGTILLTPDAYVEVGNRTKQVKHAIWLEVDRGTEHLRVIQEKCQRYWRAFQVWQENHFPQILFVVTDEQRKVAIANAIKSGPVEARQLFIVQLNVPELVV